MAEMPYGHMSCTLTLFLIIVIVFSMYYTLRDVIADRKPQKSRDFGHFSDISTIRELEKF